MLGLRTVGSLILFFQRTKLGRQTKREREGETGGVGGGGTELGAGRGKKEGGKTVIFLYYFL